MRAHPKPFHFALVTAASFIICFSSLGVVQLACWINGIDGFFITPWDLMAIIVVWGCAILPYSIFLALMYRWFKWKRVRTAWLLAPAILFCAFFIFINLNDNLTPEGTFSRIITHPVPDSLNNLRVNIARSLMGGNQWIFYFELDPVDAEKLMQIHPFEHTDMTLDDINLFRKNDNNECALERFTWFDSGWPLPHTWSDAEIHTYRDPESHRMYFLITDSLHRSFYVHAIVH